MKIYFKMSNTHLFLIRNLSLYYLKHSHHFTVLIKKMFFEIQIYYCLYSLLNILFALFLLGHLLYFLIHFSQSQNLINELDYYSHRSQKFKRYLYRKLDTLQVYLECQGCQSPLCLYLKIFLYWLLKFRPLSQLNHLSF